MASLQWRQALADTDNLFLARRQPNGRSGDVASYARSATSTSSGDGPLRVPPMAEEPRSVLKKRV